MSDEQRTTEEQMDDQTVESVEQNSQTENSAEEDVEALKKKLAEAEKKAEENWDKAVRAVAEMENMKKRIQRDLENAHKYSLEKIAKELLTVIDSLELGILAANSDHPEVQKHKEGSELTKKQLESVFEKFNIKAIDPVGEPFDPEKHQAMSMQPSADVEPNTVINVFQKGYTLNDRLIRPAMVVVSKADDKSAEQGTQIDEQA
jgi:molecular chaperone GrpE